MQEARERPLRVLFVVDFRSEIARGWIRDFGALGHIVHIVSSFPADPFAGQAHSLDVIDLGFSGLTTLRKNPADTTRHPGPPRLVRTMVSSETARRLWHGTNSFFAPIEALRHRGTLGRIVAQFKPDLIHAMRIPYEGLVAGSLRTAVPTLVSTWGNDLTLWAGKRRSMAAATRRVLSSVAALHCDCRRDLDLAQAYGFSLTRPHTVLPGGGGVDTTLFHPGPPSREVLLRHGIASGATTIINPRGARSYIENDAFFLAWRRLIVEHPAAIAICPGLAGDKRAARAVRSLGLTQSVRLLPLVSKSDLAELFRASTVSVSPSTHDGTPNTLLESMASGCFPVSGDLESIREWITPGENGLLFDPRSPDAIANSISNALSDAEFRLRANDHNVALIFDRAEHGQVMNQVVSFYREIVQHYSRGVS